MDKIILCSIVSDSKRLETTKCTHHQRTNTHSGDVWSFKKSAGKLHTPLGKDLLDTSKENARCRMIILFLCKKEGEKKMSMSAYIHRKEHQRLHKKET